MSTSISPSSFLRTLEQHNRSKSTVSSSDTDVDSAGYTSSSGTTTPEDDAQTFHLGPMLQNVLADKPKQLPLQKPTVVTKHRSLSSAVRKVKRVAHALAVFKKKRSDDNSPILISSPLRERFGKRMSVKPHPDEGFYSLPNRRFSFSDVSTPSRCDQHQYHPEMITRKFGTISGSTSGFTKDTFRKQRSMPSFLDSSRRSAIPSSRSAPVSMVPRKEQRVLTFSVVLVHVLRILLFVPWCAAVGGALLLFPTYVELVAFGPGYLASPKGIRRFAHWAECGQQHVMIFLAFLVAVLWCNCALGLSLTSIVVSRFVCVWHGFKVDRSIPLGEDDQQSLYLVVMGLASVDGSLRVSRPGGQQVMMNLKTDDSA